MHKPLTFLLSILLFQSVASAATFYVSPGGSGSACSNTIPCALSSAINSAQAGDIIYLKNGFYGDLSISGRRNADYITIAAQAGHNPGLRGIVVRNSSRWIIRGLNISPELTTPYVSGYLVDIHSNSDNITIEGNNLFFTRDSSGWSASDWTSIPARYALLTSAPNVTIRGNHLKNIYFGMVIYGDGTLVEDNIIENIGGDGMVCGTNNAVIQYNTIKNFYKVDGNHDDAIQFHRGSDEITPIENITIRGNLVISHEPHLTNPLLGSPQGICSFGNPLRNFVVENNVVLVQHWHGISMYGARDSRIINNIVFDPTGGYSTWISLDNRGRNTVVRNNMASSYTIGGTGVTADHNIDIEDYGPDALFADYRNYDVRHRPGSPTIDAGSNIYAPDRDIDGVSRPQGAGYDIGAYEFGNGDPPDFVLGDVTGNGEVSSYDASLAAQYSINLINLLPRSVEAADVTVNGEVSSYDASLIAQYSIGLIDGF